MFTEAWLGNLHFSHCLRRLGCLWSQITLPGGEEQSYLAKGKIKKTSVQASRACCHYSGYHDLLTGTQKIRLKR